MGKYKYEKFQIKAGQKTYLLSRHDGDNWEGPCVEHFAKQKATKIGYFSSDRKYKYELAILNPAGTEYTFKICNKDGNTNGSMIVVINKTMYIGKYYTRDGFNGIVYRLKQGENVILQEYKHGILIDECIDEYIVNEDIARDLPFDAFFEETEVVERKIKSNSSNYVEWVVGDPTSHQHTLAVAEDRNEIRIGQYKNSAFNGLVMKISEENQIAYVLFYKDNKPLDDFKIIHATSASAYAIILKTDKGFVDYAYAEKDKKMQFSVIPLDENGNPNEAHKIVLPNSINPDAPKPYGKINTKLVPKHKVGLTAEKRLNRMIGLQNVKDEINKLKALMSKNPNQKFALNFAFIGNPGTGKTEVARLLAEILYDEGILKNKNLVETDRSGLVAEYVGQTAIKTHAVVQKAMGGVLFIDEAYSLKPTHEVDFGKEAIDALITDMENYKGEMCFILAGYEAPLKDMINTNKGFKSRVNHFIRFDDYTKEELKEVAKMMLEKARYTIDDDALNAVIDCVELERCTDEFANARTVRNVLEQTYACQAVRTLGTNDHNIILEDVNKVYKTDGDSEDKVKAIDKLSDLIGLTNVKKDILKMKALLAKKKASGQMADLNLNMCFYGNPGTGKTEVARLIADILHDEGILPTNNFIETDRSGLVAGYVGQTAEKTHKLFKSALNGVLFIDEAYSLANGSNNDFGKEAIDALITDMENYRGKICVILAGYKKPMENMIHLNPGFDSRINRKIDFPDYDMEELLEIAKMILKNKKYTITEDAIQEIGKILIFYSKFDNFANARTVRNVLESLTEIQALRTDIEGLKDNFLIKIEDVLEYESDHNINFENKKVEYHSFNLSYRDFVNYSKSHDVKKYVYENNHVVQSSVNIRVEKDGQVVGEGSGFFISPKGIIATCAHVVSGADSINVLVNFTTSSNQTITKDYKGEVIQINEIDDTAIIGILNSKIEFSFYPLELEKASYPKPLTEVVMGGYPFGGNRFEEISVTQGSVQSVNIDKKSVSKNYDIYVDLPGFPGNSGAGVINFKTGRCVGIFSGCAVGSQDNITLTINKAIPVKYLWKLLQYACDDYDEYLAEIEDQISYEPLSTKNCNLNMPECSNTEPNLSERNNVRKEDNFYFDNLNVRNYNQDILSNIHIVQGDITEFKGDAIVNAANKHLLPGGGVSGAVFKKAGFKRLSEACEKIGYCEVGNVVSTEAFDLNVKRILHAVGPKYDYDRNPERLLNSVYDRCFEFCSREGLNSIAFPSISTGTYRFPLNIAIPIALGQMVKHSRMVDDIYVYCYDEQTYNLYLEYFEKLKNYR